MPQYRGEPEISNLPLPGGGGPPYAANDSRISYNEACFSYAGSFDLICLFGTGVRYGPKYGGKSGKKSYPDPESIELFLQVSFTKKELQDKFHSVKRYEFKKEIDTKITTKILSKKILENAGDILNSLQFINTFNKGLSPTVSSSLKLQKPKKIILNSNVVKKQ